MLRISLPLFAVVLAAPAFAGGYVAPIAPMPAVVPLPAPGVDWTGIYGGVQLDSAFGNADAPASSADLTGHLIGVFAGYRYDLGSIVVGGEVDYMVGSLEQEFTSGILTGTVQDLDANSLLRVGAELGYDLDAMLAYVSFGYADMELSGPGGTVSDDGVFVGIGIDYMLSDQVVIGAETNYHRFQDFGGAVGNDVEVLTIGMNLAYRF